jgi:acyl carrier protein
MPDPLVGEEVAAAVVLRAGASATERELQEALSARLASFKVPRRIVLVDEIPKGPTGKPQRIGLAEKLGLGAMPAGSAVPAGSAGSFVPPRTALEQQLAGLFGAVLRRDVRVGAHDAFFDLGGDSVLAAQLLARIRAELGVELTFLDVFRGPTVAQLASAVEAARAAGRAAPERRIERREHPDGVPLTFAQQRLWYLEQLYPRLPAYRPVTAVRFGGPLQVGALERALGAIVARHDALRARIEERDGVPVQLILPAGPVALPVTDLQAVAP